MWSNQLCVGLWCATLMVLAALAFERCATLMVCWLRWTGLTRARVVWLGWCKLRSAAEEQPKPVPGLEARVVQRGVEPHCPINPPGWMRHHTYT